MLFLSAYRSDGAQESYPTAHFPSQNAGSFRSAYVSRVRITRHCIRLFCIIPFTVAFLLKATPPARADDAYPPGWNVRDESVGPILYDFRPGVWNDYKRYWPEDTRASAGNVSSRPIPYGPVMYQMQAGGERYRCRD